MSVTNSLATIQIDAGASVSPSGRPQVEIANAAATPVQVAVVSGGTAGTQYTDGGTPPASPIGTAVAFNSAGTWRAVSNTNPLPVTGSVGLGSSVALADGITGTIKATVAPLHNNDNQNPGGFANGILTGGVAQLLNATGNLDRQRETGVDGVPPLGIATGAAQFAMGFATTATLDLSTAGTRTFTPAAMSGAIAGVPWSIQVGSVLAIDAGASKENVVVTSVTATTFVAVTAKAHTGTVAVAGFVYNQERDAAGELDLATGAGTALAVDYLFNGGGPGGNSYDRERSLQGLGLGAGAVTSTVAGNTSVVFSAAPTGLQPGTPIALYANATPATAPTEVVYVAAGYTSGTAVPIVGTVANTGSTYARYGVYAATGPGLNGFLPTGEGVEVAGLWSAAQQQYFLLRAAETDAMAPANVPAESEALWNGSAFERARSATIGDGAAPAGLGADAFYAQVGTGAFSPLRTPSVFKTAAATATGSTAAWTPAAGKRFRLMRYKIDVTANAAQATAGVLTIDLQDAAASVNQTQSVFVPGAAGATMGGAFSTGWVDLGNGVLSAAANNVLNLNLSAALTSGTVRVILAGTEE